MILTEQIENDSLIPIYHGRRLDMWQTVIGPGLGLIVTGAALWATAKPKTYRKLPLREKFRRLLRKDKTGLAALIAFAVADINFFVSLP